MVSDDFIDALIQSLGPSAVLYQEEDTRPYECDALTAHRELPLAVVLPRSEAQIVSILAICRLYSVPVVPRGAGTGLSGGARPLREGVVISTARMTKILELDPLARTARVEPGVRNLAVSEAAASFGLYYAPDPSSQVACTIGGNVAENSGGVHCLKYGLTLHNVLGVRGVLSSGEIIEIGGEVLDAGGLDLLPLVIGSEGMLMIVTEVLLKLTPKPACARVILASFPSTESAASAVADILAAGIIPAGLEMMDRSATHAVEAFVKAGYDLEAEAILLCESDGSVSEVDEEIQRLEALLRSSGATSLRISKNEEQRLMFWSGRKNAFPAAGRLSPDYYCMDGTVPRRRMAELLSFIKQRESHYGLRCMNVFHAGDGNMHPLILFDASDLSEW